MIFLNSASSAESLVFYLPGGCTHTDTGGKQRSARVQIFKILGKNTIFIKHPVTRQGERKGGMKESEIIQDNNVRILKTGKRWQSKSGGEQMGERSE